MMHQGVKFKSSRFFSILICTIFLVNMFSISLSIFPATVSGAGAAPLLTLTLVANPSTTDFSTLITATVVGTNGNPEAVIFSTTSGKLSNNLVLTDSNGIANTTLLTSGVPDTVTVAAKLSSGVSAQANVTFTLPSFNPQDVTTIVTAGRISVKDWQQFSFNVPNFNRDYEIRVTPLNPRDFVNMIAPSDPLNGFYPYVDYFTGYLTFKLYASFTGSTTIKAQLFDTSDPSICRLIAEKPFTITAVPNTSPTQMSVSAFNNALNDVTTGLDTAVTDDDINTAFEKYINLIPQSPSNDALTNSLSVVANDIHTNHPEFTNKNNVVSSLDTASSKIIEQISTLKFPAYECYNRTGCVIKESSIPSLLDAINTNKALKTTVNQILTDNNLNVSMESEFPISAVTNWSSHDSYIELPKNTVADIFKSGIDNVLLNTSTATMCLKKNYNYKGGNTILFESSNILSPTDISNGTISFPLSQFDLKFSVDGMPITDFDGNISVHLPYAYSDKNTSHTLTVMYLKPDGTTVNMGGIYNDDLQRMAFSTNHFSLFFLYNINSNFSDTSSVPWAQKFIDSLYAKGKINGTSATEFSPNEYIKREDFTAMLVNLFDLLDTSASSQFTDVVKNVDWFYPHVSSALQYQIIKGISSTMFGSGTYIEKQDVATVLGNTLVKLKGYKLPADPSNILSRFTDAPQIADYARSQVALLVETNIMRGVDATTFSPVTPPVTRAQASVALYQAYLAQSAQGLPNEFAYYNKPVDVN